MMLRAAYLVVLAACGNASHSEPSHAVAWHEDLATLVTTVAGKHPDPFFHLPEAAWKQAVADLDAKLPSLDDAHVTTALVRLVASIGDTHTMIGAWGTAGVYPVTFTWFDDGIFVTGATERWAVGKRLVGIGTKNLDEVLAAITPLIAHDSPAGLHAHANDVLGDVALLAGLDLATLKSATFVLADADGTKRPLAVVPGMLRAKVTPPAKLPLHLQGPPYVYWNKYDEPNHLLYFAYDACAEDPKAGSFAQLAAGTLGFVDQHQIDRFVIDLRRNEGGNSEIIKPLIDGLAARPALAGKIYAIIGMHTFSSGMLDAMDLKRDVHATLVGGATSGKPNAYGEIKVVELPHSHLPLQYSTKRFSFPDFPGDALVPDVAVPVTAADWFSGRDPALDAILAR
ncbi:MAG: hypothetical protein ABJE66_09645 [Deltaproteobacteria bacterium]